jgi:hypothetical protein
MVIIGNEGRISFSDVNGRTSFIKPISEKLSQYRYFFILAEFMILYCIDSLGCIDNNNIELINNDCY